MSYKCSLTLSGEVRVDAVDHLGGGLAGPVVGVVDVAHPALAAVPHADVARVGGAPLGPLLLQVLLHHGLHVVGRLVGDYPNGELT